MDRFYNSEDPENEKPFFGNNENSYDDDDDDDDESVTFLQGKDLFNVMQAGIDENKFIKNMLNKAINIAKKSWFWKFKSAKRKSMDIAVIYHTLMNLSSYDYDDID